MAMPKRTLRCRWCGDPIKKFIIGWIHDNPMPSLIPQHLHRAEPEER